MFAFIQTLNSTHFSTLDSGLADISFVKTYYPESLGSRPGVETGGHLSVRGYRLIGGKAGNRDTNICTVTGSSFLPCMSATRLTSPVVCPGCGKGSAQSVVRLCPTLLTQYVQADVWWGGSSELSSWTQCVVQVRVVRSR